MNRENELLEEIRSIQKAKATDKLQFQSQMAALSNEVTVLLSRVKLVENERDQSKLRSEQIEETLSTWETRERDLLDQIDELKTGTAHGAHALREELQREKEASQIMRLDHQNLLRASEQRLHDIESQNINSMRALAEKEKELNSLKLLLNQSGGHKEFQQVSKELELTRAELNTALQRNDEMKDLCHQYERKSRQAESELKASQMKWEDERRRVDDVLASSDQRILQLEDQLKALKNSTEGQVPSAESHIEPELTSNGSLPATNKMAQLMDQIQSLSKQLLKKQEQVMELQTEKSVHKSRIVDLLAR